MQSTPLIHARVWHLAGPMILSNLTIPLLGMVDTAVVGHLEHAYYLGAVALGGVIFDFIFWGFGFLRMGTTGITAQALNRGNEIRAILGRSLLTAWVVALVLLAAQRPIAEISFHILDGSKEVEQFARQYFQIRIWSAPATLSTYVLLGWFLGMHNTRFPLIILLTTNICNIILDIWFVVGKSMAVTGVALASVIAEYTGLLLAILLAAHILKHNLGDWRWHRIVELSKLKQLFWVNTNIFIRTLCLLFALAFFTAQSAKQSDHILAANAVLLQFQMFMAYGLEGFAHAIEALVGRAVGLADLSLYRVTIKTAGLWSLLVALLFTVLYGLSGHWLVGLLTNIEAVKAFAISYLPWVVASPIISVWCFLFDGIFIGATRTKEMRNTMFFSTFLCYLPAWYILQPLGNHGLWIAFLIFMAARGISMAWIYPQIGRDIELRRT